jgi:predicted DNA-binding protein
MATIKRRINITLAPEVDSALRMLAKRDRVPAATKVSELLNVSLELEEDRIFSELADERLSEKKVKWKSHKDVWGK